MLSQRSWFLGWRTGLRRALRYAKRSAFFLLRPRLPLLAPAPRALVPPVLLLGGARAARTMTGFLPGPLVFPWAGGGVPAALARQFRQHTERRAAPGNTGNGFPHPSPEKKNTGRVCEDPLPPLPVRGLLSGSRRCHELPAVLSPCCCVRRPCLGGGPGVHCRPTVPCAACVHVRAPAADWVS